MKKILAFFKFVLTGFFTHRCALHAAGLAYFSLLALVPLLCLLMVAAKACGAGNFARAQLNGYLEAFVDNVAPAGASPRAETRRDPAGRPAPLSAQEEKRMRQRALALEVRDFANPLFDRIESFDISTFGWIGFGMLLWTIVSTFSQIELAFNAIWRVARPRPLPRRIGLYLLAAVLLPAFSAAALSLPVLGVARRIIDLTLGATVYTHEIGSKCTALLESGVVSFFWTLLFMTLAFAFLLAFFPHGRVRVTAALKGGGVTALVFIGWVKACTALQLGIGQSSTLYGSFATPLIVLAWIYMSWQIVLFGANLTYAFQNFHTPARPDRDGVRA